MVIGDFGLMGFWRVGLGVFIEGEEEENCGMCCSIVLGFILP